MNKKMPEYITDEIEISFDDSERKNSNEKQFYVKNCDEKNKHRLRLFLYLKHFD